MNSELLNCQSACVNCNSTAALVAGRKDGKSNKQLLTVACSNCGLVRVDPMPSPNYLKNYYQTEYRTDYKKIVTPKFKHVWRAAHLARERISYFRPWLLRAKTSLDIGAGGGEFVAVSKAQGIQAQGIEPNEGYARFAQNEYGLDILNLSIEGFLEQSHSTFDVISCFHVLEHLPDPVKSLKSIASQLKPSGCLLLEVPNILYRYAAPGNTFFQAHIYHFSSATLRMIINKAGLECVHIQTAEQDRVLRAVISNTPDKTSHHLDSNQNNAQEAIAVVDIHKPQSWWQYFGSGQLIQKFNHRFDRLVSESFLSLRYQSRKSMLDSIARSDSIRADSSGKAVRWFMLGVLFCEFVT
jgi:2-polyprenyl-3-methyl-5-hydroxy-6-metoxy-1,4-benzoquinol methylase